MVHKYGTYNLVYINMVHILHNIDTYIMYRTIKLFDDIALSCRNTQRAVPLY